MAPVIVDGKFIDADKGLKQPVRNTSSGAYALKIKNLDRTDPPKYNPGSYSREAKFNKNIVYLSSKPAMPRLVVDCQIAGFDPSTSPILWRLQTSYVVGRYQKKNHDDKQPEYAALVTRHFDEWTGEAHSTTFVLFAHDLNVTYDNLTDRVSGGNCILSIAWKPADGDTWLQDYVHLRIVGTNPDEDDVRKHDQTALAARDPNFLHAANAVFAWEAGFRQFEKSYRTEESFRGVLFAWPPDPANFPVVAFDFGIGISQYTHWGQETNSICWDWRDNINYGINELLEDFKDAYRPGIAWIDWGRSAWGRYNGGDPAGKGSYAKRLAGSGDGLLISTKEVPAGFNVAAQTKNVSPLPTPLPPRHWPVPDAAPASSTLSSLLVNADVASLHQLLDDAACVDGLVKLGGDPDSIRKVQNLAADDMVAVIGRRTLHNACAITLSHFLIEAGITVPKIFGAGTLARYLEAQRYWRRYMVGQQRPGDVGVTEDHVSSSGADHIYLVVKCDSDDEMTIADNQKPGPHPRSAGGHDGKTRTAYFLRAHSATDFSALVAALAGPANVQGGPSFYPDGDEDTNRLEEPFHSEETTDS